MEGKQIIKEYSNGDITVIWKPRKCIHAEVCIKKLPSVYRPDEKPWIQPENASADALQSQIDGCPSGALTYRLAKEKDNTKNKNKNMSQKVEVTPGGPLMVHGELEITMADGSKVTKKRATAFCRCGASDNKPYCDGSHKDIDFTDN
ncbi:MAG: (4Fe-4S)-binding protein [Muriicola sp.]|nr:(4Fe-4S)-binding protein [Muriicola sp.]